MDGFWSTVETVAVIHGGGWLLPVMEAVITMGGGCWPRMDTGMVVWLLARHGSSHGNGWFLVSNGEVEVCVFCHADKPESWMVVGQEVRQ